MSCSAPDFKRIDACLSEYNKMAEIKSGKKMQVKIQEDQTKKLSISPGSNDTYGQWFIQSVARTWNSFLGYSVTDRYEMIHDVKQLNKNMKDAVYDLTNAIGIESDLSNLRLIVQKIMSIDPILNNAMSGLIKLKDTYVKEEKSKDILLAIDSVIDEIENIRKIIFENNITEKSEERARFLARNISKHNFRYSISVQQMIQSFAAKEKEKITKEPLESFETLN